MFGESESESPRVPSPWDPLIASASASPSPAPSFLSRAHTPSPLSSELAITLPRLVPESDDGNVEYKLQLLNPSPARFARLVTQLKWRLLEGGGQAYYELGVADSGDLVGLSREELEQTLETLEMMAGEIGASVIVVKEVEIPAALAKLAKKSGDRRRLLKASGEDGEGDDSAYSSSTYTETTEGSREASDDDLSSTVILDRSANSSEVFAMDEIDGGYATAFAVDLEISSVFKPRPVRTRAHVSTHLLVGGKNKRGNKMKYHDKKTNEQTDSQKKGQNRRETRDKKREEKRKALVAIAAQSVEVSAPVPVPASAASPDITKVLDAAVEEAAMSDPISPANIAAIGPVTTVAVLTVPDELVPNIVIEDEDDDVFGLPSPISSKLHSFPTFASSTSGESHLVVDPAVVQLASATANITIAGGSKVAENEVNGDQEDEQPRSIVEALVVRKMSLEEGFLDFGGFAIL